MQIDSITTAALLTAMSVAMAVSLLVSAVRQPRPVGPAQRVWAAALVCAPVGWLLLSIANSSSIGWLAIPAKALIIASFVGYLHALMVLRGSLLPAPWQQLPVLAVAFATTGFYFLWPDQPMRTGLLSALCAAAALVTAIIAHRHARAGSRHGRLVSVAFLVAAAVLATRAILLFAPEASAAHAWVQEPIAQTLLLGTPLLAPLVATLGFVLMGSDRLLDRLEAIASTDELTGVANRQGFMIAASHLVTGAQRLGRPCSLLAIDVDHFKSINDSHGHDAGDRTLSCVARTLKSHLRSEDHIGRCGGDEFEVMLPGHGLEHALAIARRLCQAVAGTGITVDRCRIRLSVSIGVTELSDGQDDLDSMRLRADHALYEAKRAGRNQAMLYRQRSPADAGSIQIKQA